MRMLYLKSFTLPLNTDSYTRTQPSVDVYYSGRMTVTSGIPQGHIFKASQQMKPIKLPKPHKHFVYLEHM